MSFKLRSSKRDLVFREIEDYLACMGFNVVASDFQRPWGGFFVVDEQQAEEFARHFFPGINRDSLPISGKLSPKILVVEPHKRLSWQYHHRRAEIWRSLAGNVGIVTSQTDEETEMHTLAVGETIHLAQGQRHRLVGISDWGVLAEIWQHTDLLNPSDEDDIVRVQDDFGRSMLIL